MVWHSAKEYFAHREFEAKEKLEKVVNQLLNERGLIINWSRKLKHKGNAVNAIVNASKLISQCLFLNCYLLSLPVFCVAIPNSVAHLIKIHNSIFNIVYFFRKMTKITSTNTTPQVLVVASGNPGKLKEMQAYLADLNLQLELKPENLEIEETGETFIANARLKAAEVAKVTGKWAIADDSGLVVEALGGKPGIYSARYAPTVSEQIERVLKELGDCPNRQAQFVCVIAIAQPDGKIALEVEGICCGEILYSPRGNGGFGYDPIFYIPSEKKTFAEMSPEMKRSLSHRGQAFQILLPQIKQLLGIDY